MPAIAVLPSDAVWCATWSALWDALLEGLGPAPQSAPSPTLRDDTLAALLAAYREPQRHYHTLEHLHECLRLWDRVCHLAQEPSEVALALWFHDAVYDVKAHDNEQRSAAWAATVGQAMGLSPARRARIEALIMVTRHDAAPHTPDEQLMVDVDLSILGAAPARFDAYEQQIRAEYAWVPGPVFRAKRRDILKMFLARDPLYHTAALDERLTVAARTNLRRSLQSLS